MEETSDEESVNIAEDLTLYAQWVKDYRSEALTLEFTAAGTLSISNPAETDSAEKTAFPSAGLAVNEGTIVYSDGPFFVIQCNGRIKWQSMV